jgi:beta-glucosidase
MLKLFTPKFLGVALVAAAVLGCATKPTATDLSAASATAKTDLSVLPAPAQAWRMSIHLGGQQADLSDASAQLSQTDAAGTVKNKLTVSATSRDGLRDTLMLQWKDTWYAPLNISAPQALDLRAWLNGTLELDLRVTDMANGGLLFKLGCGEGCERKLSLIEPARAIAGQGWKHLAFPMSCLVHSGDNFSAVKHPFSFEVTGNGQVEMAKLRLTTQGQANTSCPDYRTQSVTPAQQVDTWTQYWWPQRHEAKLEEVRRLKVAGTPPELVFIGDSITNGWETAGKPVWEANFAKYHALNLGYGGDHTENVLWRLQHGELDGFNAKVVTLMIGTNNTGNRQEDPVTTAAGIRRVLDEILQRQPQAKVLLLAIFPRDKWPNANSRQINEAINKIIATYADGKRVFFLNINTALMNPDGTLSESIFPDLLHPNEVGYDRWAKQITSTVERLMAR